MKSVQYFLNVTQLVISRDITWQTYRYALAKRPAAVCGRKFALIVGRI